MIYENNNNTSVGNKAKHLFTLKEMKLNVPNFSVIPYADLKELLIQCQLENTKENILKTEIPQQWIEEIQTHFKTTLSFAVRSSTDAEDSENKSYAGQFTTKLNVKPHQLAAAIKEVWLSIFQAHIASYEGESKSKEIPISIIIQECIEADVSGVLFTINPINSDKNCKIINALYGLGEGLVSGKLDADLYEVKNGTITNTLAEKNTQYVYNSEGDIIETPVSKNTVNSAALSNEQIIKLVQLGDNLANHFQLPQDIEFCIKGNEIFILQSRPITTLINHADYLIWDNSNIVESYPGVSLPLTFSFISPVYSAVYQQMSGILGISKKDINANIYTYDNMLGLLKGRVYYNLYSWYKLLSLLPGYSLNAGFMEKMMGVSEKFELKDYKKPNSVVEKIRVFKLAFSMLRNAIMLPRMKRKFTKKFNQTIKKHKELDIPNADATKCMHAYYTFETTLAKEWKAPLVNDFFAMIYYGIFQKLIDKYAKGKSNNQFLIKTGKVITTEPADLQQTISLAIQKDKVVSTIFSQKNEGEIWQWLLANNEHPITKLIQQYIDKWGNRCFAELKLETITYTQNPLLFIKIIKNTFEHASVNTNQTAHLSDTIKLNVFQKLLFNFIKRNAINTVSDRENLRFDRTRAFAEVRLIFIRIGQLFAKQNHIENERDIFYLSKEEVFNFIKGTSIQLDLKSLIALRKNEYELYFNEPSQKARIKTTDVVYGNYFGNEISENQKILKGIGCCPGIVKAEVRVVNSPNDIENLKGKILVTMSTDPGWVSVFPLVKGILVQRGSVLSHAAIVSREMNIPCIVGITNITAQLKDGQIVEMNGLTGEIIL